MQRGRYGLRREPDRFDHDIFIEQIRRDAYIARHRAITIVDAPYEVLAWSSRPFLTKLYPTAEHFFYAFFGSLAAALVLLLGGMWVVRQLVGSETTLPVLAIQVAAALAVGVGVFFGRRRFKELGEIPEPVFFPALVPAGTLGWAHIYATPRGLVSRKVDLPCAFIADRGSTFIDEEGNEAAFNGRDAFRAWLGQSCVPYCDACNGRAEQCGHDVSESRLR